MDYLKVICAAAWNDTWDCVIGSPFKTFIIGLCAVLAGWAIKRHREGEAVMKEEIRNALLYAVTPLVLAYTTVFIIHLFYVTPKRLYIEQKDKVAALEKKVIDERPHFVLTWAKLNFLKEEINSDNPRITGFRMQFRQAGKRSADNINGQVYVFALRSGGLIANNTLDAMSENAPDSTPALSIELHPFVRMANAEPYLVAFHQSYRDSQTKERISQNWFLRWGDANSAIASNELNVATKKDTELIYSYFRKIGVDPESFTATNQDR